MNGPNPNYLPPELAANNGDFDDIFLEGETIGTSSHLESYDQTKARVAEAEARDALDWALRALDLQNTPELMQPLKPHQAIGLYGGSLTEARLFELDGTFVKIDADSRQALDEMRARVIALTKATSQADNDQAA